MKTVICSHGFGVRADSRGMFPEIAVAFPDYAFDTFDYCEVTPSGDTILRTLEQQAEVLQQHIDAAEGDITLLCHSMGCVVAGLADLSRVSNVVLLAPPDKMHNRLQQWQKERPGSYFQDDGTFVLPRTDGTTSYLPPAYIASIEHRDPMELYQRIADSKPTTIVRATDDEVIGLTKVDEIKNAAHKDIAADHNFNGSSRVEIINVLRLIL